MPYDPELDKVLGAVAAADGEDVMGYLLKRGFCLTADVARDVEHRVAERLREPQPTGALMLCPKCRMALQPWPWADGGYRGVQCSRCDCRWWSNSFGTAAADAENSAMRALMMRLPFPEDAVTDEQWQREAAEMLPDDSD